MRPAGGPLGRRARGWLQVLLRRSALARRLIVPTLLRRNFARFFDYPLDLRNPRTLSEKIQWLKVYGRLKAVAPFVDKYEVRNHVREAVGESYLVPLVGVYDRADQIPWDRLPARCVIKTTHGSGWNLIVNDSTRLDRAATIRQLDDWLAQTYYDHSQEEQYLFIRGRLIVEEMLGGEDRLPWDYKFFCYAGVPRILTVDVDRLVRHRRKVLDMDWRPLPGKIQFEDYEGEMPRPPELERMVEVAKKLSAPFPFVRVDLYLDAGRVYFGELTFTPGSGLATVEPREFDVRLGEGVDLPAFRRGAWRRPPEWSDRARR
jgi:hypothetical protein